MFLQIARASGGGGVRPVIYGLLNMLPPQAVIARRGGGRTVTSQVLGGGKAGTDNHFTQDGPAKIVSGDRRKAGPSDLVLQNAV